MLLFTKVLSTFKEMAVMKKILLTVVTLGVLGVAAAFFMFGYVWRDFDYTLQPVVTVAGNPVEAAAFLSTETAGVYAYFDGDADFYAEGRQAVDLLLQRGRFRAMDAQAALYVVHPVDMYTIELGAQVSFDATQFIRNPSQVPPGLLDVRFVDDPPPSYEMAVGEHPIALMLNGTRFYTTVQVVDTTPPRVYTQDITRAMGQPIDVWDVVTAVFDLSPVDEVVLIAQPDYFVPGDHTVEIRATDAFGNYAVYPAVVTFLPNTVPPVFYGVRDIYVSLGEAIRFREGVQALDAFGRSIHFDIDNTAVDIQARGVYPVTFTATDAWGLYTTVSLYVSILNINPEAVHALADDLLTQIINDGMTQTQQTLAIFNWLQHNVGFAAGSVVYYSMYEAMYQGLMTRRGNCAVFASLMELFLARADIPHIPVRRQNGNHRWVLVNPDDMGWHHVDPTPNRVLTPNARFMMTQTRANSNAAYVHYHFPTGTRHFYMLDMDLLPGIVIVP